jgi:hypothetical protein
VPPICQTSITADLENRSTFEHAQWIANHESPKLTKVYDRTSDQIILRFCHQSGRLVGFPIHWR